MLQPALQHPESPDRAARERLSRMLMTLFDHWDLSPEDRLALLGLDPASRTTLSRYRNGAPLAGSRDLIDRAGHLLGIHKALRVLFPRNRELAYRWMTSRNAHFGNRSPVEVVRKQGFAGLLMVRAYLDEERGR
ncbi:MAG: MbcA/ParS/Xre antitoxin family protein [Pseudomonadota bacterium]|nr:MbcA/ParS/Xre antitoxin family protein [Pseudomonadota bacterium]